MLEKIFDLEPEILIPQANSYILSYPYILSFFADKQIITSSEIVIGSHVVYGWMPTILELDMNATKGISLDEVATLLTLAKTTILSREQLMAVKGMVNNSIVGASKLLHFVAPENYPIWDSRVYEFIHNKKGHAYQVNNVDSFLTYQKELFMLTTHPRFPEFQSSVNSKVGYPVSGLRALELMMFLAASSKFKTGN